MSKKCDLFLSYLDFLHNPKSFPRIKRSAISVLGIIIFLTLVLSCIGIVIYKWVTYEQNYVLTYSQGFIEKGDINQKISFGFRTDEFWRKFVHFKIYDSSNKDVFENMTKICDENLNEIKENETNYNNYTCLINYEIKGSNISNHLIKIRLLHINKSAENKTVERLPFHIKFKEPSIKHDKSDPFDFSENLTELTYFYDLDDETSYRKYIKIIDYSTSGFLGFVKSMRSVYLEDSEDTSKTDNYKNLTEKIGSFRLSLTRRKDIFTRKYSDWLKILSELGGIFSFMKLFASILVMIFVNPNDNLRIYDSFIKNNKLNEIDLKLSSEHINDYLKIKNQDTKFLELNLNNKRKCDKCHYLFCWLCHKCCNTGKYKVDFAISDYIEENLNIESYLENHLFKEEKRKQSIIDEIKNSESYKKQADDKIENFLNENYIIKRIESNEVEKKKLIDEEKKDNQIELKQGLMPDDFETNG